MGRRRGLEQVGFWRKLLEHPSYDAYWRDQAVDKILAAQPLKVPVMLVHSLWDQEDIYGDIAVYKAIEPKDTNNWHNLSAWPAGCEKGCNVKPTPLYLTAGLKASFIQNSKTPGYEEYVSD